MSLISTQNLTLSYKDGDAVISPVKEMDLSFTSRGLYLITGPSGSGKTSLLYLLSGIRQATSGKVLYADKELTSANSSTVRRTEMGFVFQSSYLINYLTVEENVVLGAENFADHSRKKVLETLKRVGLEGFEKRKPYQLSGGQKQRVAIARSLMNSPKVIFADEPTGSLDETTGRSVVNLLKEYSKSVLVIMVTHDLSFKDLADEVVEM
jgi:putative ABC transport system ATP-binding protein